LIVASRPICSGSCASAARATPRPGRMLRECLSAPRAGPSYGRVGGHAYDHDAKDTWKKSPVELDLIRLPMPL
jgi:hypothetical protein